MSKVSDQGVTWQDLADRWSRDPAFQKEYAVIKPTLDRLGITPGGGGHGSPPPVESVDITVDITTTYRPPVVSRKSVTPDAIGADADEPYQGNGDGSSHLGPGLPPQAEPYRDMIEEASRRSGVPASLLAGLIHDESRWDPGAATNNPNGRGDTGLVQMNDNTFAALQARHPELQGRDKNDPATNILAGAFYLADMKEEMKQKYGKDSWEIALRAYNSGENGVDPNNLSNLPAGTGTANYVEKVMRYWKIIDEGGTLPA